MKKHMYPLLLMAIAMVFSFTLLPNVVVYSAGNLSQATIYKTKLGGAYLLFAEKFGGKISREEINHHSTLGVDGCARGSRIYQFTIRITRNGKTVSFQARSNQLSGEMISELKKVTPGDEITFENVKAYLPNVKDSVDVLSKKFIVI